MPVYEVFALRYATHQRPASANLLYPPEGGDPHEGPMPIDYFVWVIRDAGAFSDEVETGSSKKMRHNQKAGTLRDRNAIVKRSSRVVLVDTGFDWPACAAYGRTMVRHPLEGLRRLGVDPSEVRDVIVTHLHYDHAGNLPAFPNATFHLQDAEMAYATGRCMCHARLRGAFAVEDVCAMVRKVYEGRVAFVDGDGEVAPGITVHAVPGHTRGLQCVRVETERGPVVLASDAAHFYANLAQQNPFPIVVDVAAMMESWRRLARLAGDPERIVPGHDPLVMARYPRHPDMEIEAVLLHRSPTGLAS